jgi:hypothetical protein
LIIFEDTTVKFALAANVACIDTDDTNDNADVEF